jgi:ribonuclease-3
MDAKGMANGWFMNPKILEDVFEALVGALYLDLGLLHAKEFVLRVYNNPELVNLSIIYNDDNWKDHLMKYCQTNNFELPEYRMQSHVDGVFHIEAYVRGMRVGSGYAKSKKQAEQNAAKAFFYPHTDLKVTGEDLVTCTRT